VVHHFVGRYAELVWWVNIIFCMLVLSESFFYYFFIYNTFLFIRNLKLCFEPEVPYFFDSFSLTVPYKFLIFQFSI